ncbi:MAG: hypothetical protein K2X44_07095 [Magnetospirillum sp.]|nr:hypothetical protein [Magnetospirillum sp.]
MGFIRNIVRFGAAPVFFLLAGFNYLTSTAMAAHMSMMGMDMGSAAGRILGVTVPSEVNDALGSMWLMYALMGVFHAGAWLRLGAPTGRREQ